MSNIYSDRDYLDDQFKRIHDRFDRHEKRHRDSFKRTMTVVGTALTALGALIGLKQ